MPKFYIYIYGCLIVFGKLKLGPGKLILNLIALSGKHKFVLGADCYFFPGNARKQQIKGEKICVLDKNMLESQFCIHPCPTACAGLVSIAGLRWSILITFSL